MPFLGKTPSQIVDPEVDIDGGTIDGVSIGSVTANAGAFTNLTATGTLTLPDDGISGDDVNGGTISNFASTGIDDNATSTAITIDSSQRVGIGVTPASIFNVGGSLIVDQSGDTVPFVKAFRATTGNNRPIFQTESSVGVTATFAGDGNTGLGIATPQEKLHVYTTADSRVEVESTTGLAAFKATNNQGSYAWYVDSSADKFHLYDFTDASNRLTLDGSGNFGIGTDAPNTYLSTISGSAKGLAIEGAVPVLALKDTSASDDVGYIYQSTNDMRMANYAGGAITFNIGSSFAERFSIESDGALHAQSSNTGTNPAANAHIASELRFFNTSATDNNLNAIGFYNSNQLIDARIAAVHKSHSSRHGELVFMTHSGSELGERARIDSSGRVGIGLTPSYKLDVDVGAPASQDQLLGRFSSQAGVRSIAFVWDDSASTLGIGTQTNHALAFHINGSSAEKMRLDTSGNLLVGRTHVAFGSGTNGAFTLASGRFLNEVSGDTCLALNRTDGAGSAAIVYFYRANYAAGQITATAGASPAFAYVSDVRLKDNVTDHESELANVMSLRPVRWDWNNLDGVSGEGFIAQELEQTAWADLVSEGDDGYKTVSGLGAVETRLIKALQEAVTRIETLEAEVAALKGE